MAERQHNSTLDAIDSEELKRYLFFEASENERAALEEKFFESDELFYELLDLENGLTDDFVRGRLGEINRKRFEASLEKSPERRAKLANAKTLQAFIAEETKEVSPVKDEETPIGFWGKIKDFFNFGATSFQYATAVLLLLLFAGIGFLIYERGRSAQELARLREVENQRNFEIEQKEKALQEQIRSVQEREQNLQNQLAEQRGQTEILSEELEKEQSEKARIERELENLKRQKSERLPETQQLLAPTIATVILAPAGGKGDGDAETIVVGQNTKTISATLQIPKDSSAGTFSVTLNSAPLAANLKSAQTKSGSKFVRVQFPSAKLAPDTENLLTVTGDDGSRYNYALRHRK